MSSIDVPTADIVHGPVTHAAPHLYGKPPKAGSQADSLSFHLVYDDVLIPMRDGVELAGDLYIPSVHNTIDTSRRWPCVLIRTPYDSTHTPPGAAPHALARTQTGVPFSLAAVSSPPLPSCPCVRCVAVMRQV